MEATIRSVRKLGVTVAGISLLIVGVVMLVLPGPGTLFILAGLTVLAKQFRWAERLLGRFKLALGAAMASFHRALGYKAWFKRA